MVGLGIFVLPHTTKDLGILGFAILYPIVVYVMTLFIIFLVTAANEVGYHGASFGELHEIILGPKYRLISEISVFVNSFFTCIAIINAASTLFIF